MDEYDQEVGSVRLAASLAAGQPPVRFNHEDHDEEGHDDNDDDHDVNDYEDDYEDYDEFGKLKSINVAGVRCRATGVAKKVVKYFWPNIKLSNYDDKGFLWSGVSITCRFVPEATNLVLKTTDEIENKRE